MLAFQPPFGSESLSSMTHTILSLPLRLMAIIGLISLATLSCQAGAPAAPSEKPAPAEPSLYDQIWGAAVLYKNKDGLLNELDLSGRFQFDWYGADSNRGDTYFTEIRRFRLGVDTWWLDRHMQLKATVDTNLQAYQVKSVFYNRMTDLFVNFHINDALNIRIGKFEPHFGFDREYSDNLQKFFERSFFDDQIFNSGNDYLSGVSFMGRIGKWGYQAAMFSNNTDREYGQFNGGQSYLAELNYDFSQDLGAEKALLALNYLHSEPNGKSTVFNTMRDAAALYFDYQKGPFGLVTQIGYGHGLVTKGDLVHFQIMPTYMITKKLELVARFEFGQSSNDNGITTAVNREERTIGRFTGDSQHSEYIGLNYYLYGQKLKLMIGEQHAGLTGGTGARAGYDGWTTLAGFRMFF